MKFEKWTIWTPAMVFLVVVLANISFYRSPHLIERGDQAANALQIERAKHFSEYLGPYSRFEFHHPGPATFYYLAMTEKIFFIVPAPLAKHMLAQLVLNLLWTVGLVRLGVQLGLSPPVKVLLGFAVPMQLIALSGGVPLLLGSVWGPVIVVLPVAFFVCCAALIADGQLNLLPWAVLAAVFSVHNHLGTVVVIGPAALFALVGLFRARRCPNQLCGNRRSVAAAALIAGLAILPVVYEELTANEGNLSKIVTFVSNGAIETHPWREVLLKLGSALTDPMLSYLRGTPLARHGVAEVIILSCLLTAGSILAYLRASRRQRLLITLLWLSLAGAVISARFTRGNLSPYLYFYVYGLVGLVLVVSMQSLLDSIRRWRPIVPHYMGSAKFWAILGLTFFLIWIPTHRIVPPSPCDDYTRISEAFDLAAYEAVHLHVNRDKTDGALWIEATSIALQLVRDGVSVTVPDNWVFLYGEAMRVCDEPPKALLVLTRQQLPLDYPGICDLGEYRAIFTSEPGVLPSRVPSNKPIRRIL